MTALNKQALRQLATDAHELGIIKRYTKGIEANKRFAAIATPLTFLALLDELEESEELRLKFQAANCELCQKLEAAEKRIAEHNFENRLLANADRDIKALRLRIAELEARAFNPAILDVIAERHRQQSVEGWTPEHDNAYQNSELADAAACYAIHAHNQGFSTPSHWPWSPDWWKQSGARRDLVKAGALIIAEIERIDRAAGIGMKGE